jgi:hypothetical protein
MSDVLGKELTSFTVEFKDSLKENDILVNPSSQKMKVIKVYNSWWRKVLRVLKILPYYKVKLEMIENA